ncbi:MAG TPA: TolC family protein, partial [Pyrinomonadaceae bacterium]|nr:TolC family protein [Pyrinomonadaceae bacterium]
TATICRTALVVISLGLFLVSAAVGQTPAPVPTATPLVNPTPTPFTNPTPLPGSSPGQVVVPSSVNSNLPAEPPPVAPNFRANVGPLPSGERVGVDAANQLSLTIEDAVGMALENNRNVEIARNNREINVYNLKAFRGVYDPLLAGQSYFESVTTPTASAIGGAVNGAVTQRRFFGTSSLSGLSPIGGGSYSANFDSSRTTTSNTNSFLNPQYPSVLTFNYTQPLLRNRSIDQNRRQIEIAKRNVDLTDSQFRAQAITTVYQVEQAYWNLVFALRTLQVQLDAVKQAQAQLESNERQVRQGVQAPIDVVATTSQIATFQQNAFVAQQAVTTAENQLKTLILGNRSSAEWGRPIMPISPVDQQAPPVSLETATAEALKNRPELEQIDINREINKVDERYFRNQTKPQVDLFATYSSQGLAGTTTERSIDPLTGQSRVPANLSGNYLTSLANLFGINYPTYRAGVTISLPLGNRTAKANLGRTLVEGERLGNQRAQQEIAIEADVRDALEAVRSTQLRLATAVAARESYEQLYESEQRQFRAGTTTLYLVLQRQTDLITARGRELFAQTDLNKAISDLNRALGRTLVENEIVVKPGAQIDSLK